MPTFDLLLKKRREINRISSLHGASRVRVFGSVACGKSTKESDVDFLVDLEKDRSILDLGGLLMDLQDLLGCKVDVVTENGLHWSLKEQIIKEAKPL